MNKNKVFIIELLFSIICLFILNFFFINLFLVTIEHKELEGLEEGIRIIFQMFAGLLLLFNLSIINISFYFGLRNDLSKFKRKKLEKKDNELKRKEYEKK